MQKIPQEEYDKTWGQFRLQLNGVMEVFNLYGLGIHITQAIEEITALAEVACMRVRGKDIPLTLENAKTIRQKSKGRKKS
uniref:Uncharacterized protein n=1 Tax=viral metagenome TaxID=1070528 RepID=A0A6M3J2A5_9ZZZZ